MTDPEQRQGSDEMVCGFKEPCDNSEGDCPDGGCMLECVLLAGHSGAHSIFDIPAHSIPSGR